jgi:hypothetical protein
MERWFCMPMVRRCLSASKPKPLMFELRDFKDYVRAGGWLIGIVGLTAGSSTLADLLLAIGPPWPPTWHARSLLTAIVLLMIGISVYSRFWRERSNKAQRSKHLKYSIRTFLGIGLVYLIAWGLGTFSNGKGERQAKGFVYTEDMRIIFSDTDKKPVPGVPDMTGVITNKTPMTEVLRIVGYDATKVWEESSIFVVSLGLLVLWLILAASLAAVFGTFIVSEGIAENKRKPT